MRVKILKRSFAGAEFAPDIRVLKVGGQSSAGVERLEFELPAEWKGLSVTLHVQWLDGTLPAPVLLDDGDSVAVDKTLTASPSGQWMLLALGADGVLICRPFVTAVYGGGEEGGKCYIDKLAGELADTMQMCGAHSIAEITPDMVRAK